MPYQIFKITRPPEEPPLTRIELGKIISLSRKNAEWEVMEVQGNWRSEVCYSGICPHERWDGECRNGGKWCPIERDEEDRDPEEDDGLESDEMPWR